MNVSRLLSIAVWLWLAVGLVPARWAEAADGAAQRSLLELSASDVEHRLTPTYGAEAQVSVVRSPDFAAPGLLVTVHPGKANYPGVEITPERSKTWDLSAYGHVETRVINTGAKPLVLALRVDNEGDWHDNPWNSEQINLQPGASGTVVVIFGYSFGRKPGYPLKSAAVVKVVLYTLNSAALQSFRVESLVAAGPAGEKPPVDPQSVRLKPKGGILLGSGVKIDAASQIEATGGAQGAMIAGAGGTPSLRVVFPAGGHEPSAALKPTQGRWDLGDACEVRIALKNDGQLPVMPVIQLVSNGGPTNPVATFAPLVAGARQEIVIPFAAAVPFKGVHVSKPGNYGGQKGTGTNFTSDAVAAVKISAKHEGEATLLVEAITADALVAIIPDWLGKRPPVPGDWVKTLDEDFDGPAIDESTWNIYGPNYWDKKTHWSKDNLILDRGVAQFHFEKKPGYHNDDPRQNRTDYACGFLETYGKWVQRYGYFEARVKLPRVPGLWPTFWLMPDRGVGVGPHEKRQDTDNGGMEFDIMEHLTRWGPYRYNIALHWDGYGKSHKAMGSACNYVQADKDGYITSGLLWTPGAAAFYGNGKELWRWEDPRVSNVPSGIIIEITTGGWDNNAVDDAQLPANYLIDYVRVWQRRDLASNVDGKQAGGKTKSK